jgi:acetoin utilization deacetylase AcuC-like enzyme
LTTAFLHHPDCALHDMGEHHPECPERVAAVADQLIASGLAPHLLDVEAPLVATAQLERVHDPRYVAAIEAVAPASGRVQLDPDTIMCAHTLAAAKRAAGAVVRAVDLVIGGEVENAFCCVRPPGHHAERRRAMGFCIFNNVAVGAAHALAAHGLERVAVIDFDVHHGNGTEDIFRDDPRVLMASIFQHPFYPYSGVQGRSPRMVNVPLAAYSDGRQLREAVLGEWLPALESFRPQMLFVSAGFDAHREDPLASLNFVEADYRWVTARLMEIAARHGGGRLVSVLEGGYQLSALGRSATAHLRVLAGLD